MRSRRVVVLGGGPAGYAAAVRAAQRGAEVILIERDELGGVCANRGCIPLKALLHTSKLVAALKTLEGRGIKLKGYEIDYKALWRGKDSAVGRAVRGLKYLLERNGVEVVKGEGKLVGGLAVEVGGERVEGDGLIVATGSKPLRPAIPGLEEVEALDEEEALDLRQAPERLLIVGGGPAGVELATLFNGLGSEVYLVEKMSRLLPRMDAELCRYLERYMRRRGVKVVTNATVEKVRREGGKVVVHLSGHGKLEVDRIIFSVGRRPNSEGLGLEGVGVKVGDREEILVDGFMSTNVPGIYAAGDVVGRYFLAYTAYFEGEVAAENALGGRTRADYGHVPLAVFSEPEVASVGLREEEVRGLTGVRKGVSYFLANGRAISSGMDEGLVKVLADAKGRLLGVHIVGPEASELACLASAIMKASGKLEALAEALYVHPTFSEALKEAALAALGRALHA